MLLALFAKPVAQKNPGVGVVFDIKSSSGLIELLQRWGARPIMSPAGHSIIKDMMNEHHALLGGELSCHFSLKMFILDMMMLCMRCCVFFSY